MFNPELKGIYSPIVEKDLIKLAEDLEKLGVKASVSGILTYTSNGITVPKNIIYARDGESDEDIEFHWGLSDKWEVGADINEVEDTGYFSSIFDCEIYNSNIARGGKDLWVI